MGKGKMFICQECGGWTGVDNTTGDCWVEHFDTMCDCLNWLYGRIDSDGNLYSMEGIEECITCISEMTIHSV